jgi:predicted HicB family RNase H-like nuclease
MPKPLKFADESGNPIRAAKLNILIHPHLLKRIRDAALKAGKSVGDWLSQAAEKAME